ncbi:MAG: sulfatase-like hydrolase/transferase, partial [Deltaproteobacteria bacterium]|nr:sulfatase-like hydrolase/transferase [Deltaproteobacteria bacterium]
MSTVLLLVSVLAAPVGFRLMQVAELVGEFCSADVRGMLSDVAISAVVILLLSALQLVRWKRIGRLVGIVPLLLWIAITTANYEHVRALGTMVSWTYAGFLADETFLAGSVAHITHPVLLAALALVTFAAYWLGTRTPSRLPLAVAPGLALVGVLVLMLWPLGSDALTWRQRHFLVHNLYWAGTSDEISAASIKIAGVHPADLDGEPIIELDHQGHNVLLIVLEGISGAYLDSVAQAHEITAPRPRLPELDQRARKNLTYINFFNQQRQTNRGLYSLICGDLPKLQTNSPKMSDYGWRKGSPECLATVLRRNGYETLFVQAAPLAFMGKDKFMPKAGYDRVLGFDWFDKSADSGKWGVNDAEFFEQVVPLVDQLRDADRPWFLTLLTAGTHHPFQVPESFASDYPKGTFGHSVTFLNKALGPLCGYLETSGVLDDTLVLITSDESFGVDSSTDNDSMMLAQAFGTLTVMVPGRVHRQIDEPFMQMDVALSVLDYLGYRDDISNIGGRSVFRAYSHQRVLPYSNTYLRMTGAVSLERELYTCIEDFSSCNKYRPPPDRLFSPRREKLPTAPEEHAFIKRLVSMSLHTADSPQKFKGQLIETGRDIPLVAYRDDERIDVFSSQYISVPAGTRIDVDLSFELLGDEVEAKVRHGLYAVPRENMPTAEDFAKYREKVEAQKKFGLKEGTTLGVRPSFRDRNLVLHRVNKTMRSGYRFKIKYSYVAEQDLERLNCAVFAWLKSGTNARVRFTKATLRTRSAEPDDPAGLNIRYFKVKRPRPPQSDP